MMVMAPEPKDFVVTLEQFRAAIPHWQPHAEPSGPISQERPVDALIKITRPNEPFFQIFHYRDGDMLSTDGTPEQAAEVAVWAANTFPKTGEGELWIVDEEYTGHTVLTPGMNPADVWANWQTHT
jgi:hypothetical protein